MDSLMCLDDGCLMKILEFLPPLPDRFNTASSCKRLRNLAHNRRLWLVVVSDYDPLPSSTRARRVFKSLGEAVQFSQPGDTIALEGSHSVRNVIVPWPLVIRGVGDPAHATHLKCGQGAEAALDIRASTRISNISITSWLSGCIMHRSGHLRVENCYLHCEPNGLDHLFSALITVASDNDQEEDPSNDNRGGVLSVVNTQIQGGSRAVHCNGSGSLQSVRVTCHSTCLRFWFYVDSKKPGSLCIPFDGPKKMTKIRRDCVFAEDSKTHVKRKKLA